MWRRFSAGQRILYLYLSFALSPSLHRALATTPTRATKTTMRAERNGKESAKEGRNGDAETGKMYMYEKRWMSFMEKEKDTHIQGARDRQRESGSGTKCWWQRAMLETNELNERRSQEPVAAHSPINMYSQYPLTFGHSTRRYRHADRWSMRTTG